MKNIKGFTVIEGLLFLVIVGLLGGTGWYVWHTKSNTDKSNNAATQASNSTAASSASQATVNPIAGWVSYSNSEGIFSLKHPRSWVEATHPDLCNPGLFLVGADASSVGKCATESFGQMSVASVAGDSQKDNELGGSIKSYDNITTTTVTVDNVKGEKQTGTASGNRAADSPSSVIPGTKVTKYIFYTNGRTYTAIYIAGSTYPDVLSDFDLMVTKTLKFSS